MPCRKKISTLVSTLMVASMFLIAAPGETLARETDLAEAPVVAEVSLPPVPDEDRRGLTVVLGADVDLAAALHARTGLPVQCLALGEGEVGPARARLTERGLYGAVTVALWRDREHLPYADNLATLLVAPRAASWQAEGLDAEQMLRVLAPYGTLALRGWEGDLGDAETGEQDGWLLHTKPYPEQMDVWPQYGYDASGSMVSRDHMVGPVRTVRWMAGKTWTNDGTLFSEDGRVYLLRGGAWNPRRLEVRDAFSGLKLWSRNLSETQLIAADDRVYAPLAENDGNLVALDGATGQILQTYDFGSERDREIEWHRVSRIRRTIYHEGVFLTHDGRQAWDARTGERLWEDDTYVFVTPTIGKGGWFPVRGFLAVDEWIVGIHGGDARSRRRGEGPGELIRRGLRDGTVDWKRPLENHEMLWAADAERVLTLETIRTEERSDGRILRAYNAEDGSHVWSFDYDAQRIRGTVGGLVGGEVFVPVSEDRGEWRPAKLVARLDAAAGELIEKREIEARWGHRCHLSRSTEQAFLLPDGLQMNLGTGAFSDTRALRGGCAWGYVPANGMLYQGPNVCSCYNSLRGWAAFGPEHKFSEDTAQTPLLRGPAYGADIRGSDAETGDWPLHRGGALRHGATTAEAPERLEPHWSATLESRPTAPVVAGEGVYVAVPERHEVVALDRRRGRELWRFVAEGPVPAPPTYWRGRIFAGCAAGWVYALDAGNGNLIWRRRLAPTDRQIVARGRMESLWPVLGGVLVEGGVAYAMTGRHVDLDGGLFTMAMAAETGEIIWSNRLGADHDRPRPEGRFSANPTLLQADEHYLYVDIDIVIDRATGEFVPLDVLDRGERVQNAMWGAMLGFLDETVLHEGFWGHTAGRVRWHLGEFTGILLTADASGGIFGVLHGQKPERERYVTEVQGIEAPQPAIYGVPARSEVWFERLPEDEDGKEFRVKAMAADAHRLYAAVTHGADGEGEHALWVFSSVDGRRVAVHELPAEPRFDGMAITSGGLFLTTDAGDVVHFGAPQ